MTGDDRDVLHPMRYGSAALLLTECGAPLVVVLAKELKAVEFGSTLDAGTGFPNRSRSECRRVDTNGSVRGIPRTLCVRPYSHGGERYGRYTLSCYDHTRRQ